MLAFGVMTMTDTLSIYGYVHGQTVQDRHTGHYGYVHAYGVLTARGPLAEVRWASVFGGTEELTATLTERISPVSWDLPRTPRPLGRPAVPAEFPDGVRAPRVTPRKPRSRAPQTGTEHTCNGGNGPMWGRKLPGCPRCDELLAGAPARTWG